mmetsp:Transcript_101251/g.174860  ORF Transcript_101251/g.174860 Transcript_101251/m.174860 type:complete len:83 (+) Transcript_101251:63-311(+)
MPRCAPSPPRPVWWGTPSEPVIPILRVTAWTASLLGVLTPKMGRHALSYRSSTISGTGVSTQLHFVSFVRMHLHYTQQFPQA